MLFQRVESCAFHQKLLRSGRLAGSPFSFGWTARDVQCGFQVRSSSSSRQVTSDGDIRHGTEPNGLKQHRAMPSYRSCRKCDRRIIQSACCKTVYVILLFFNETQHRWGGVQCGVVRFDSEQSGLVDRNVVAKRLVEGLFLSSRFLQRPATHVGMVWRSRTAQDCSSVFDAPSGF